MARLQAVLSGLEQDFDVLKYRLRERMGDRPHLIILPYRGYGTPEKLQVRGRVLEAPGVNSAADDTFWDNLANTYRRFMSNEIPYARVRARFQGVEQILTANVEGFFEVWIEPHHPLLAERLWHEVELELLEPLRTGEPVVRAVGEVFVPPDCAEYAVISDIDDTVVRSDVDNPVRMARALFLNNAHQRMPFLGVATFYGALHGGSSGLARNPLFYVSSSPWNMYDLLSDFFQLQAIPVGPILLLRDWGLSDTELLPTQNRGFKLLKIRDLLETYSRLPFILIGDTTQQDPEIYEEIVSLYPGRILAVYIRDPDPRAERLDEIALLAQKTLAAGTPLVVGETTLPLAQHAAAQRWIDASTPAKIAVEQLANDAPNVSDPLVE